MRNFRIRQLLTAAVLLLCAKSLCAAEPGDTGRDGTLHTTADTVTVAPTINELRELRGLTSKSTLFVPKGQWIFGGTVSYSTHTNDNYSFLIIEGIGSEGYNFRVSPMIAYAVGNNSAVGARFIYERSLLRIASADVNMGDEESGVNLTVDHYYALEHAYTGAAIWRQYIPLGHSKRFAIFTEMQLAAGGTQAKFAMDQPVKGTYQTGYKLALGVSPGLVAFATNNMAIEVSVGVMGVNYSHTKQVHNRVVTGERSSSSMNFKVNIFSIGLGMAFYL